MSSSSPSLQICCLYTETSGQTSLFGELLSKALPPDRYSLTIVSSLENLIEVFTHQHPHDGLVIWGQPETVAHQLERFGVCLPTVVILSPLGLDIATEAFSGFLHEYLKEFSNAVITLTSEQLTELPVAIDRSISTFLELSPYLKCNLPINLPDSTIFISVAAQQERLAEKLKARLGYLGIYSKRDPEQFVRRLSASDREVYLKNLKKIYRLIILEYFKDKANAINQLIDEFANLAFLGDVSVSQVLEIHMHLMDEFAKRLKLEGRSEEILLDYRIALIDVIAHLCEMYRRSVTREA